MKFLSLILTFVLLSCVNAKTTKNKPQVVTSMATSIEKQFPSVSHITIEEFIKLKDQNQKTILVDVRSEEERTVSIIPGAISKEEFLKNLDKYKGHKIVSYCTIGYRSSTFSKEMSKKNIKVFNLKESALGWAHRKKDFVTKDGKKTKKVHVYGEAWDLLPSDYQGKY